MSMNLIQFHAGPLPADFVRQYRSDAPCRRAFYRARWPKGFRCFARGDRRRYSIRRGTQTIHRCRACQHQRTLISGTLFQISKLPLITWFLAIRMLASTKTTLPTLEHKRHPGVSHRTAWRLKHKSMQAVVEREETRRLEGLVQIDDACLGGERNRPSRLRAMALRLALAPRAPTAPRGTGRNLAGILARYMSNLRNSKPRDL